MNQVEYENQLIPASLDNYKIVQLSDLHGKSFGYEQSRLLRQVEELKPDLIVLTGDLIDSKKSSEGAYELVKQI